MPYNAPFYLFRDNKMLSRFPLDYSKDSDLLKAALIKTGLTETHFVMDQRSGSRYINTEGTLLTVTETINIEGDLHIYSLYYNKIKLASKSEKSGPYATQKHNIMRIELDALSLLPSSLIGEKEMKEQVTDWQARLPSAESLAKSMSSILGGKTTASVEHKQISSANTKKTSIAEAHKRLKGTLTIKELEQLSHTDDLLNLSDSAKDVLIANIKAHRPDGSVADFGWDATTNDFLDGLTELLSNGVSLTKFASLNSEDQRGFVSFRNDLLLFMKNGIEFDKFALIHIDGLYDIREWLNGTLNFDRMIILRKNEDSPDKRKVIESIIKVVDDKILRNKNKFAYH